MCTNSSNSNQIKSLISMLIAVFAVVTLVPVQKGWAEISAADLYEMMSPSVVRIFQINDEGNITSQGSGFFIDGGYVATNHHVVDNSRDVKYVVETYGGTVIPVLGILAEDPTNDLAILLVGSNREKPLLLRDHEDLRVGSKVYVLGSPVGLLNTISDGLLSGIRQHDGNTQLQITAPISPGSSGGPVFNEDAELIGVVVSLVEKGQNLNFAIPYTALSTLVASVSDRTPSDENTFRKLEDNEKSVFVEMRIAKLLAEARFQAKAKDNRPEAFKLIAAAMRLDPSSKEPPHVLRTILRPNELTYGAVASALLNAPNPNYFDYPEGDIVDIVVGVKSDYGGHTELILAGYEAPDLSGKELRYRNMDRSLSRMGYTVELKPEMTRDFPSDPESYLPGEIVRIRGRVRTVTIGYLTGKKQMVGLTEIDEVKKVDRCVVDDVTEFEVLSK